MLMCGHNISGTDEKRTSLHQSQLWHIATPPLHWVHRYIQHSSQAQMHIQGPQPKARKNLITQNSE